MVDYVRSIRSNHRTLPPFFSTSDMDKLGKVRRRHWEVRLNISKLAKFESECLKSEDIAKQSCENLRTFVWGGVWEASLRPHPTIQMLLNFATLRSYTCIFDSFQQITSVQTWQFY